MHVAAENSWLAFLGPNKREIVQREESGKYCFQLVIGAIFTLKYILFGKNIPAIYKNLAKKNIETTN